MIKEMFLCDNHSDMMKDIREKEEKAEEINTSRYNDTSVVKAFYSNSSFTFDLFQNNSQNTLNKFNFIHFILFAGLAF